MSFPGVDVIFLCTVTVDYHFVYQIIKIMFAKREFDLVLKKKRFGVLCREWKDGTEPNMGGEMQQV